MNAVPTSRNGHALDGQTPISANAVGSSDKVPRAADPVYVKTELAWRVIRLRDLHLSAPERALLIMVDGQRKASSLLPLAHALGLADEVFQTLVHRGLLQATPARLAAAATSLAEPASTNSLAQAQPSPGRRASADDTRLASTQRSSQSASQSACQSSSFERCLAVTKCYVLEILARTPSASDMPLRQAARLAIDAPSLMNWLQHCHAHMHACCGAQRADRFWQQSCTHLPAPWRDTPAPSWSPTDAGHATATATSGHRRGSERGPASRPLS